MCPDFNFPKVGKYAQRMLIMDIRRNADRLTLIYTATLSRFGSGPTAGQTRSHLNTQLPNADAIGFFWVRGKGGFVRTLRTPLGYVPWPVGMNGMFVEAAYSKSGRITETKSCLLAVRVNHMYERRKASILRPTFLQIESTWGDQERLSSMIISRRRVCEKSLASSFCSKSRTPVWRPWECEAMTMANVLETLIERPRSARAREASFGAAETVLKARAADICEQYRVMSSANDGILTPCSIASDGKSAT